VSEQKDHTVEVIAAFFLAERRARFLSLARSPRGRAKLRRELAHLRSIDPRYRSHLPGSLHQVDSIVRALKQRGAPDLCYIISESPSLDGRTISLQDALNAVVGRGLGSIISCVPGRLAFYEGEDPTERYVLERDSVPTDKTEAI
jgi:hypothetical protein